MLKPKHDVVITYNKDNPYLEISIIKSEGVSRIQKSLESIEDYHGIRVYNRDESWQTVDWGAHYEAIDVIEEVVRLVEEGSDYGIKYLVVNGEPFLTFELAKRWRTLENKEFETIAITLKKEN